jgi:hypothetical protein
MLNKRAHLRRTNRYFPILQKAAAYVCAAATLLSVLLLPTPPQARAVTCGAAGFVDIGGGQCRGYITAGTTSFVVPADWSSTNTIECVGAGGNGSNGTKGSNSGAGGGGGAYAAVSNLVLSGTKTVAVAVGGSEGDTYFNGAASSTASLSCAAGKNASATTAGAGGSTANSTGTTRFAGGAGGAGLNANSIGGGAGGGAAGPLGAGGAGGGATTLVAPGNGGGGANNGTNGATATLSNQGGSGGTGGEAGSTPGTGSTSGIPASSGTLGGGGGGGSNSANNAGAQGSTGEQWDATHGPSGGGGSGAGRGGSADAGDAGNGGTYGGGGGGGGAPASGGGGVAGTGGTGGDGLIVITYTPVAGTPPTVTTDAASAVGSASATLNGTITDTGGDTPTARGFASSTDSTLATGVATTTESGSFSTGAFTDSMGGFTGNTTYYFRAFATNSAGTSFGDVLDFLTLPGAPTTPSISLVAATSSTVTWSAPTGGATSYKLQYCVENTTTCTLSTGLTVTSTTTNPSLVGNTTYSFAVRGTNATGDGAFSASSTQLMLPNIPGGPTYSDVTETTMTVSWATPTGGATSYKLERCTGSGCSDFVEVYADTTASFADSALSAGTTYIYRVRATNATGDGLYSATSEQATAEAGGGGTVVRIIRLTGGLRLAGGVRLR